MLPDSRKIAALLDAAPTPQAWDQAIRIDNLLQKRTAATAWRVARLIRARLDTLPPQTLSLVTSGSAELATQTLFAAAVNHSRLLADYLRDVVADHRRRLELNVSPLSWDPFLADCEARDPQVRNWTPATRNKLRQVISRILTEVRLLEAKTHRLRHPSLHPELSRVLKAAGAHELINRLELDP